MFTSPDRRRLPGLEGYGSKPVAPGAGPGQVAGLPKGAGMGGGVPTAPTPLPMLDQPPVSQDPAAALNPLNMQAYLGGPQKRRLGGL